MQKLFSSLPKQTDSKQTHSQYIDIELPAKNLFDTLADNGDAAPFTSTLENFNKELAKIDGAIHPDIMHLSKKLNRLVLGHLAQSDCMAPTLIAQLPTLNLWVEDVITRLRMQKTGLPSTLYGKLRCHATT